MIRAKSLQKSWEKLKKANCLVRAELQKKWHFDNFSRPGEIDKYRTNTFQKGASLTFHFWRFFLTTFLPNLLFTMVWSTIHCNGKWINWSTPSLLSYLQTKLLVFSVKVFNITLEILTNNNYENLTSIFCCRIWWWGWRVCWRSQSWAVSSNAFEW